MIERITKATAGDGSNSVFCHVRILADGSDVTDMSVEFDTERRTVQGLVVDRKGHPLAERGNGPGVLKWLGYFGEVRLVDRARIPEGRR